MAEERKIPVYALSDVIGKLCTFYYGTYPTEFAKVTREGAKYNEIYDGKYYHLALESVLTSEQLEDCMSRLKESNPNWEMWPPMSKEAINTFIP